MEWTVERKAALRMGLIHPGGRDLVFIWHSSSAFITLDCASHGGVGGIGGIMG